MDVLDVHGDHCTLDWRAPDDDGGIPIENYVIEKYDTATGRWVPAAKVAGDQTTAVVDGLIPGHEYKVSYFISSEPKKLFSYFSSVSPLSTPKESPNHWKPLEPLLQRIHSTNQERQVLQMSLIGIRIMLILNGNHL